MSALEAVGYAKFSGRLGVCFIKAFACPHSTWFRQKVKAAVRA